MKRIISIWLLLLYSVASSGMTVRFHYCGDWLASVKLVLADDGRITGCCGDELLDGENDDCCNTEKLLLQVDDEAAAAAITAALPTELLLPALFTLPEPNRILLPRQLTLTATDTSPPGQPPLFILNRCFLI